jgi:hypothetical protein
LTHAKPEAKLKPTKSPVNTNSGRENYDDAAIKAFQDQWTCQILSNRRENY